MEKQNQPITSYKTYGAVLVSMIILLAASIGLAQLDLGPFLVFSLLGVAILQTVIILGWSMHLRFDQPILRIFVALVILVFAAVVIITFLDYLYR